MKYTNTELILWARRHNDSMHPGTRQTCPHCQALIARHGEMPSQELLASLDTLINGRDRRNNPIPRHTRLQLVSSVPVQCAYCGAVKNLRIDHIHPRAKGGSNEIENLQILCNSCNSRKGVNSR